MNECVMTEVRDALPDLLHGRLSELDMATMKAHVESCPACRAELALLREVRSAAPLAPAIDAARIAAALPPYGGQAVMRNLPAKPSVKSGWRYAVIAAGAAIVIALGSVTVTSLKNARDNSATRGVASAPASPTVSSMPAVLDPSPPSAAGEAPTNVEAQKVARPVERQVASLSFVGGTNDLSEAELETPLAELDGMESIPAAEPQSVTVTVEDIEGGA